MSWNQQLLVPCACWSMSLCPSLCMSAHFDMLSEDDAQESMWVLCLQLNKQYMKLPAAAIISCTSYNQLYQL